MYKENAVCGGREFELFGRKRYYSYLYELQNDIAAILSIRNKFTGDQWSQHILDHTRQIPIILGDEKYKDSYEIGEAVQKWLAYEWHSSDTEDFHERILEITTEDKSWAVRCEESPSSVIRRLLTFNKSARRAVRDKLEDVIDEMKNLLNVWKKEWRIEGAKSSMS